MPEKWTEREERSFQELVERLKFWGYKVPAGEKLIDPALLLLLKAFAFNAVAVEDKLGEAGDTIIDSLISNFFLTALKRPVPAFTMLSCTCSDKVGMVETDTEFVCHLPGPTPKDYSFHPLYPQQIYDVDADLVIYASGNQIRVLKTSSKEAGDWEAKLAEPEYREQKRSKSQLLGGSIYVGITAGLPLEEVSALQLYLGPEWKNAKLLNWIDWQVSQADGWGGKFKPGTYHSRLEIFSHLDIRELEIDANFQSRLYSSDFLTSGKLLWHFKHYLAPAKCFAYLPSSVLAEGTREAPPPELTESFDYIDFSGLKTPRLWLKVHLPTDERVSDLKRFSYFDTNTFPVINRRRNYRNKYTMGQPVLDVDLFGISDDEDEHAPQRMFSIDRVWDSHDSEFRNQLDLESFGNPRKYLVVEEEDTVKVKFDFAPTGKEPPDFVVVEFSETEGLGGNGIGADVDFATAQAHPQVKEVRNLITSQGGSDAKSAEEVKRLTGFFLRNHGVAISEGEIEYLAKNFDSRIATAQASRGVSRTAGGLLPSVTVGVTLQPEVELSLEERGFLLERLSDYLDSYTPLNLHLRARWQESA